MVAPYFPPEIIAQILSYVTPESLAPYACINALWQVIVERQTFSALNITTAGLSDLRHIVTPQRYPLVRKIYLKSTVAEYSVAERVQVETDKDPAVIIKHSQRESAPFLIS
ncbi:hypothetical protein EYZ11_012288 [Aspergillus tanneri]|uniref:F-box domain-containing protein n=1 Tax=Aspergillus tanneri TaxID=1220188 RepID=A0A4S3J0N1_9EURO|nr:hypothetical protein EYZ11_012288 [Aspergillus tanneri]